MTSTDSTGNAANTALAARDSVRASIVGGSGYGGGEVLRLLLSHPNVQVQQVTSRQMAGNFVHASHPNLRGSTKLQFVPPDQLEACDVLFLCTPHGEASKQIERYAGLAGRVIDLSADFRLRSAAAYAKWYEGAHPPHPAPATGDNPSGSLATPGSPTYP